MECRVLSAVHLPGGGRANKGDVIDLPLDVYQRLRESGDVETVREQLIRVAAAKASADVRARMEADLEMTAADAVRVAVADAQAKADLDAETHASDDAPKPKIKHHKA